MGIYRLWGLEGPDSIDLQASLSAYYHAGFPCTAHKGALRDIFVGSLWTISFCLIMYTGFGKLENWLLNFAGLSLLGVAFFPTDWPAPKVLDYCQTRSEFLLYNWRPVAGLPSWMSMHTISAIIFFLLVTIVTLSTVMDTVTALPDGKQKRKWTRIYEGTLFRIGQKDVMIRGTRYIMLYALIPCVISFFVDRQHFVLWIELIGICFFGVYWVLKGVEMIDTRLDIMTIHSEYKWGAGFLKQVK